MYRIYLSYLLIILFANSSFAQSYLGYIESNYSGNIGNKLNPANVADNRYKRDITILGGNFTLENNYLYLNSNETKSLGEGEKVSLNGAFNFDLGFMYSINDKIGIGVYIKPRVRTIVHDVSQGGIEELLDFYKSGFKESSVSDENTNASAMFWNEYSVNYGQVILDKKEHFLKGGIELKLLHGIGGYSANIDSVTYNYDYYLNEEFTEAYGEVAISFSEGVNPDDLTTIFDDTNFGFGFSFGFVYEWRPEWMKYQYKNKVTNKNEWLRNKNKYKIKFGLSVIDVGSITYNTGLHSKFYDIKDPVFSSADLTKELGYLVFSKNPNPENYKIIDPKPRPSNFKVTLPSKLNVFVDYKLKDKFYVSSLSSISLISTTNKKSVSDYNYYSITPRYETQKFDLSVPFNYNKLGGFNVGIATRYKGFFIGSSNISSIIFSKDITGANVFFGFNLPIGFESGV